MQEKLQKQFEEINNSTLHNMRFLLESYSNEIMEALDTYTSSKESQGADTLETIQKEVSSVIRTLKGIETVITHSNHMKQKDAS